MTPARAELIHRTFEAITGASHVIISLFNSTAPCFREVVFRKSKEEIIEMAVRHTVIVRQLALNHSERYGTRFRLAYGVEAFSQTEPEYVVEICTAVKHAWGLAGPGDDRIIYNLPSTVEIAPPNHYADQVCPLLMMFLSKYNSGTKIEYFCTHMANRDEIIISLHCHNDRGIPFSTMPSTSLLILCAGTAIAATELGLLAGADRVEGCLLGNGERSGNVDLVALALNMYTQGVPCGLDFSDLPGTSALVRELTALPVHPRHPYAGELIFTAFSGQHQDGIKKGLEARAKRGGSRWDVPYLPLDPTDVGRTYDAVIRVNSQSGKGGIAYVVRNALGIDLPRVVQQDFYRVVQERADNSGEELSPGEVVAAFRETYRFPGYGPQPWMSLVDLAVLEHEQASDNGPSMGFTCVVCVDGSSRTLHGEGMDLASAFVEALHQWLGVSYCLVESHTSATANDSAATRVSFALLSGRKEERSTPPTTCGIGVDPDPSRSTVLAVISAVNRALGAGRPVAATADAVTASWKDVLRILEDDYAVPFPHAMHNMLVRFCAAGGSPSHLSSAQAAAQFVAHYCYRPPVGKGLPVSRATRLCSFTIVTSQGGIQLEATIQLHDVQVQLCSTGTDAPRALLVGLGDRFATSLRLSGCEVALSSSPIRAYSEGDSGGYVSFVRVASHGNLVEAWGIGVDADVTSSMLQATLVAAVNCGLGMDTTTDSIEL